jgi:hypothetical protein
VIDLYHTHQCFWLQLTLRLGVSAALIMLTRLPAIFTRKGMKSRENFGLQCAKRLRALGSAVAVSCCGAAKIFTNSGPLDSAASSRRSLRTRGQLTSAYHAAAQRSGRRCCRAADRPRRICRQTSGGRLYTKRGSLAVVQQYGHLRLPGSHEVSVSGGPERIPGAGLGPQSGTAAPRRPAKKCEIV